MWRAESNARFSHAWSQIIDSMRTKHAKLPRILRTVSRARLIGYESNLTLPMEQREQYRAGAGTHDIGED
jgi:hypothetical protein